MEDNKMSSYKFPLIDVAKYAKNHYRRTDSIWYDMALCLWKNGQGFGPFFGYVENDKYSDQERCFHSRVDICQIIISRIRKLLAAKDNEYVFDELTRNISPQESWRVGYYTKQSRMTRQEKLPEWEYWEAVLRANLSCLSMMTHWELGYENWSEFESTSIKELEKPLTKCITIPK